MEKVECDECDGVGWLEGGKTLKSTCSKCGGSGIIVKSISTENALEPRLNTISNVVICDMCLDGAGGECHVPGCVMFLCSAPDIPIRDKIIEAGGNIKPELNAKAGCLLGD